MNGTVQIVTLRQWTLSANRASSGICLTSSEALSIFTKRLIAIVATRGLHTVSVTRTAIAFIVDLSRFRRRKARHNSPDGFLDLQHEVRDDRSLRDRPTPRASSSTSFGSHVAQLDESFAAWVEEAYQVGQGDVRPRKME
jgi:hypothetical protein